MERDIIILLTLTGLPIIGLIVGLVLRKYHRLVSTINTGLIGISVILALTIYLSGSFIENPQEYKFQWMLNIWPGFLLNSLTALLIVIVTGVSLLVHIFSLEYMKHDQQLAKYYAFLGLFTFSMLGLVIANNFLQLFVFWELVGFSSYLLIGFWFTKDAAAQAARKAFIVNRIGDIGFLIAILIIYGEFETLYFTTLADYSIEFNGWMMVAGFGLLLGALGKSAQFPLLVWLPDAMEGPTPVSALIHAATMVAAGIFLLARSEMLLDPIVLEITAFIGVITATMAGFTALFQHDIKKILAYSTISQLGYMLTGIGVGAADMSIFHLTTHAFFKAGLFLSAGSVIHAMHHAKSDDPNFDEQDMRWMGGLRKKIPITFISFVVCGMALAGLPLFSGFLSKDAIITQSLAWAADKGGLYYAVPDLALITALLTAIYIGRLLLLVFFGNEKSTLDKQREPWSISIPLILLSILSVGFVYSLNPFGAEGSALQQLLGHLNRASNKVMELTHIFHFRMVIISSAIALFGLGYAYYYYGPKSKYASKYGPDFSHKKRLVLIIENNWFLDKVYHVAFVRPFEIIAGVFEYVDRKIVDGFVNLIGMAEVVGAHLAGMFDQHVIDGLVNFVATTSGWLGQITRRIQSGQVQLQFVWALIGIALIIVCIKFLMI
jgi:NADH-quinone oxidoreductase subunit L